MVVPAVLVGDILSVLKPQSRRGRASPAAGVHQKAQCCLWKSNAPGNVLHCVQGHCVPPCPRSARKVRTENMIFMDKRDKLILF